MDDDPKRPPRLDGDVVRSLIRFLRKTERECKAAGLSLPQYRTLAMVARGTRRAAQIADTSAVSRPAITALVSSMAERGLLLREPASSGDRRAVHLRLTPEGLDRLDGAENQMAMALAALFDDEQRLSDICAELGALEKALDDDLEQDLRDRGGSS